MLKKSLGLWDVFSIAAGAMISSGLFVLPGIAFARTGPAVVFAYLLAGVLYLPAILAQAELATAMPKSGGSYFSVERTLGAFAGTLAGFISWLCISLKAAFACVGLGTLVVLLFPDAGEWVMKLAAVASCVVFAVLNLTTVKGTGRLQGIFVALLLGVLLAYVFGGAGEIKVTRYSPFFAFGWRSFFAVTGMVFISFGGLTKVVDVAEEIRLPHRNLPLGMFLSFVTVNLLYVAVVFVTVGILDGKLLSGSLAPLCLAAETWIGPAGAVTMGLAAFLAYATTGNAGILAASRSPMAMSRDGLLPAALARTNSRFGTPHAAIIVTSLLIIAVIVFLSVEDLAKTASTMFLLSFVLANASVIVMRYVRIPGYRPSLRMPLCPWLPAAGIVVYGFLIADMGLVPLLGAAAFTVLAGGWYLIYVQQRIQRQAAVVYMVKGLLSKQIERSGLEDELVQVSLEREGIEPDRFDELIRRAVILDVGQAIPAKELFARLGEVMAPRVGMTGRELEELLLAREKESSTVILPGLAIPHVVVEGRSVFEVAMVRCRPGVIFSDLHPPVHTAFVLVGSRDERNFHLKALVSIAHIVQERAFADRWMQARDEEQLRDIVLLSGRQRIVG